ncbi:MAG: excinuclease ABC subunit C [Rickettsiales bacterium]|nr:excinuclease ABC subunit C [Rickettsiales bacterium]
MMEETKYNFSKGKQILKDAATIFPNGSGIYKFLDNRRNILYVGKAKNLKKRISSYLNEYRQTNKTKTLISETDKINFIKTPSEIDSLILENNLIKEHKPKFNIRLVDDKSYPFIIIEKKSKWARIRKFRGKQNNNDIFFGPFSHSYAVDEVLKHLEKAFLIRSCSDNIFNSRKRPCILYQIKRCSAPCVGKINITEYNNLVDKAILFLKGKNSFIKDELMKEMKFESDKQNFETAAILRDRIKALTKISHEKYSDLNNKENFDVICCSKKNDFICVQIFFFRSGKNLGNKEFFIENPELDDLEIIFSQFLIFFYSLNIPPKFMYINTKLKDTKLISGAISKKNSNNVIVKFPSRGKKLSLVRMVEQNISISIENKLKNETTNKKLLKFLQSLLKLRKIPQRIEIYDNSHLNGTNPVGVMVVYQGSNFQKNLYKKFNINNNNYKISDDYFMMSQVIDRRFTFSDNWKLNMPDLMIIDGGKGHVSKVKKVLSDKKINDVEVIGIAKGRNRNKGEETIYTKFGIIKLEKSNKGLFFLQRLRDEAHRFAISSQKIRRNQAMKTSVFDKINGVGNKTKKDLLSFFGSIENVKTASLDDLKKAPGIGEKTAINIYKEFNKIV